LNKEETKMSEAIAAEEGAAPEAIENPVELPEMDGPRYRTRDDFNSIPDHNIRRHAWQEYQRTIEEFRQTGTGQEKARDDFAPHFINPPGLHHVVFMAHVEALEIERWQEAQRERQAEQAAAAEEAERLRAVRQCLHDQIAARGNAAAMTVAQPEALPAEPEDRATWVRGVKDELGAPRGNRNAVKTGRYTADKQALRKQIATFLARANAIVAMVEARVNERKKEK
jgi:hypothetical protein